MDKVKKAATVEPRGRERERSIHVYLVDKHSFTGRLKHRIVVKEWFTGRERELRSFTTSTDDLPRLLRRFAAQYRVQLDRIIRHDLEEGHETTNAEGGHGS